MNGRPTPRRAPQQAAQLQLLLAAAWVAVSFLGVLCHRGPTKARGSEKGVGPGVVIVNAHVSSCDAVRNVQSGARVLFVVDVIGGIEFDTCCCFEFDPALDPEPASRDEIGCGCAGCGAPRRPDARGPGRVI